MAVASFKSSDLIIKFIAEEVCQGESALTRIEDATALYTIKKGNRQWTKKNQGMRSKKLTGACFNCGKIGHYARDCHSSRGPRESAHDHSNVAFTTSEVSASDN